MDSTARRLYLSHATQVDVVDADSGKVVGTIPDTPGVHGAVVVSPFKHGFTSNGRENKVSMFEPATLQLIKKIDVGKGPDGIYYEPGSKRVFTNNHGSHDITAIDAKTGEVVGTVKVEGDGEQAVIGADGGKPNYHSIPRSRMSSCSFSREKNCTASIPSFLAPST
jgi:DNA-binding beta-propeller fold protein YncE